ncbi:MAG TPA: hypothetical protein VFH27_14870 [Longimicrobiaceae bacterium]|nr:hypothetical protein [Longimicrobiaceae bacterium]
MGLLCAAAFAALLAGCREEGKALPSTRKVSLPAPAAAGASLRLDALGREWIVAGGQAMVVDTGRAPRVSRIAAGAGSPLAAPMWDLSGRLYADSSRSALAEIAARAGIAPPGIKLTGPVARDPRGRWIYGTLRHAGIVGLRADSLRVLWGWPHAGPAATALAASPLGDRVYLALDASETEGTEPRVQVRDQQTGRVLADAKQPMPARSLVAAGDGFLYGYAEADGTGAVFSLRHVPDGLEERWRTSLRHAGMTAPAAVRLSPTGERLAVFGEGGVRLLDARTGTVVGHLNERPRDAAFDARGQLHLLYAARTEVIP